MNYEAYSLVERRQKNQEEKLRTVRIRRGIFQEIAYHHYFLC